MEKLAPTEHPVQDLIRRRWSSRAFAETMPDSDILACLIEAARWAPSSYNEQPWRFLIRRRGEDSDYTRLLECLSPGNRSWAGAAPVLMLVAANIRRSRDGEHNPHAWYDTGQAVANLTLQATSIGLVMHQMAGFDRRQAAKAFALAEALEPIAIIAIGYAGDVEALPEDLQRRERSERVRKPQAEIVIGNKAFRT